MANFMERAFENSTVTVQETHELSLTTVEGNCLPLDRKGEIKPNYYPKYWNGYN